MNDTANFTFCNNDSYVTRFARKALLTKPVGSRMQLSLTFLKGLLQFHSRWGIFSKIWKPLNKSLSAVDNLEILSPSVGNLKYRPQKFILTDCFVVSAVISYFIIYRFSHYRILLYHL